MVLFSWMKSEEMAFDLQARLLRILETGEYIKLGDTKRTQVDVRIISATNRHLKEEIEKGEFREIFLFPAIRLSNSPAGSPRAKRRHREFGWFISATLCSEIQQKH